MPNLENQCVLHFDFPYAKCCCGYTIILIYTLSFCQPSKFTSAVCSCQGFCRGSVFIVITLVKILPVWLFCSKIHIQFTIFNTYFLTKLLFTNKRYHLHVLEKCLYELQEVRSMIYFRQFIHPLSLHWHGNGTSFASRSYIIISTKFCKVTVLPVPKKNKNCDIKQKLFI